MKAKPRQSGLTLMEQTAVIAIVAMFVAFGLPAVRTLVNSFETEAGTKTMIGAALSSARAIAAKEQHYAGIRFQNKYQQDGRGCQYMIFIVYDFDKTGLANGFRAVEGVEPIKLPDSVGVMDLKVVKRTGSRPHVTCEDDRIDLDNEIDEPKELTDATSFSIIFSPSGKLVIHRVEVSNRDGIRQPTSLNDSMDEIFNSPENIEDNKTGMFVQDDYFSGSLPDLGLGPEPSRNSFVIYDRTMFDKVDKAKRWSDYLEPLEVIYINPYTGTMIEK
jgi:hypothetical protein